MIYEAFEGDWDFESGAELSFSSVRRSLSLQENLRPLIYAGTFGIIPIFYWGSFLFGGALFSTSHPPVLVLMTLVCLGLILHRLLPRKKGLQVHSRGGRLEVIRFCKGKVVEKTSNIKPLGFRMEQGRKLVWVRVSTRSAATNQAQKDWQGLEREVYTITADTEGDAVEIAWTENPDLARQTLQRLADVHNLPICG